MSGQCTCLSAGPPQVDRCSDAGALQVRTDAAKMCGYSPLVTEDPYVRWTESALVLCANVKSATCTSMSMDTGGSILVPMGVGASSILQTSGLSLGSTSSRRLLWNRMDVEEAKAATERALRVINVTDATAARDYLLTSAHTLRDALSEGSAEDHMSPTLIHSVLMENDTEWNRTAAPCSHLVFAYQNAEPLGPTDDNAVKQCAYWRIVGRKIIAQFNLTATIPDTFLLSPDDLAGAMGRHGVLDILSHHPSALLVAAMHHPWLRPIRAAFRASTLAHNIVTLHIARARRNIEHQRQTARKQSAPDIGELPRNGTWETRAPFLDPLQIPPLPTPHDNTHDATLPPHARRLLSVLTETVAQLHTGEYSEAALSLALPIER